MLNNTPPPAAHAAPAPSSPYFNLHQIVIEVGDQTARTNVNIPCSVDALKLQQLLVSTPARQGTLVIPCDGQLHSIISTDDVPAPEPPSAPAAHGK